MISALEVFKNQVVKTSIDEIKNNMNINDFNTILVSPIIKIRDKDISFCDDKHPLVISHFFNLDNTLCIDEQYYKENKNEIDKLICEICRSKNTEKIIIPSLFINESTLKALCENPTLRNVRLGSYYEQYTLTKEDYELLKKSNIIEINCSNVCEDLKENFDPLIRYNYSRPLLLNKYFYENLINSDTLLFNGSIKKEEYRYLKYIRKNASIFFNYEDYDNIFNVIKETRKLGLNLQYIIDTNNKNKLNEYLLNHIEYCNTDDIYVQYNNGEKVAINKYIEYEKKLLALIEPVKNESPYIKYLYAYNIVKQFREYKENEQDTFESRQLYKVLDSEYIVCVGFVNLLKDLLDKLEIPSSHYSVSVDIGLNNNKTAESAGHARLMVTLVDPKYNINGIYIADPTWDNSLDLDLYTHTLMTHDEYNEMNNTNFIDWNSIDEVLFSHDLDEFYTKANIWLDKQKQNYKKSLVVNSEDVSIDKKKLDVNYYIKQANENRELEQTNQILLISKLLNKIEVIDYNFYSYLVKKYSDYKTNLKVVPKFLEEIGLYFVSKVNNLVSGEKLVEGISYLYDNIYHYDSELLEKTILDNEEQYIVAFLTRYRLDEKGKRVIMNAYNKFDIDLDNIHQDTIYNIAL